MAQVAVTYSHFTIELLENEHRKAIALLENEYRKAVRALRITRKSGDIYGS